MATYDGKASIVTSAGDSFAECHLVAEADGDRWTGTLTDILWRTQMVPSPLQAEENLRIEEVDGTPIVRVTVDSEADGAAQISVEAPFPG